MAEVKDLERTKLAAEKKKERILRAYVHKEGSSIDFDAEMTRVSSEINATANAIAERNRQLADLTDKRASADRLWSIRNTGKEMLSRIDTDPAMVRNGCLNRFGSTWVTMTE